MNSENTTDGRSVSSNASADPPANQPVRWFVAALGALIAALGISGLLDDTRLLEHPWWVVFVLAALLAAVTMMLRTLRAITSSSEVTDRNDARR